MRYLTLGEVIELHGRVLQVAGGAPGIRDLGGLDSALAQPRATFGGVDLYPTLADKAQNHPFVDGNKRVGHAAMETFLILNSSEIATAVDVDEQERLILDLAACQVDRTHLTDWLRHHLRLLA